MTTLNQFDDNEFLWAADLNAVVNAASSSGINSGCSISKGTGDWDIDVTSGEIVEDGALASISSGTVTLTQPSNDADMGSGESRIDLVHVNTSDTLATTEGTAASDPVSPDIPADEVLLGFVVVSNADGTVADSDIFDIPAIQPGVNRPNWVRDGTLSGSGSTAHQYSLSTSYDMVLAHVRQVKNTSGSSQSIELLLDGDTGSNYDFADSSGGTTTGATAIKLLNSVNFANNGEISGRMVIDGAWDTGATVGFAGGATDQIGDVLEAGANTGITSPLDSFTIQGGSGNIAVKATVFGWDN